LPNSLQNTSLGGSCYKQDSIKRQYKFMADVQTHFAPSATAQALPQAQIPQETQAFYMKQYSIQSLMLQDFDQTSAQIHGRFPELFCPSSPHA
jgi:hypothetical protein